MMTTAKQKALALAQRIGRYVDNILHINRLKYRVDVDSARIDVLEDHNRSSQHRLDALETLAWSNKRDLESLERRVELLETTVTSAVEIAFKREVHDQIQELRKHIEQERYAVLEAPRRPRLAYFSPVPPERSGISDYSAELLPVLARYYDVEVIAPQEAVAEAWIDVHCPVRDIAWFRLHAADYERVLYQFGNSPFHSHMFELVREHPGVVMLHDFFLSSVLAYEEARGAMPGIWTRALYHSHGYLAVKSSFGTNGVEEAKNAYPCNLEPLEHARGVIVHSEYSRKLATQWYGEHAAADWKVVPHLRTPVASIDRAGARGLLGIDDDTFVVCSFGFIDPVKLSDRLVDAWLASRLPHGKCMLVFVGANHPGDYGARLAACIRNSGHSATIRITGWVDDAEYKLYLQAVDVSVQLRGVSRGESSGALLHCLNYGVPTIANANGAMAEIPENVIIRLPDAFADDQLVAALESLWDDPGKRHELGAAGMEYIRTQHAPHACARLYADAIESAYREPQGHRSLTRQLLVDVSTVARHDLRTGIERVVRAQLVELLNRQHAGVRVEPVYLTDEGGEWHFRYARRYTKALLGIEAAALDDAPVEFSAGDIYYSPDFFPSGVIAASEAGMFAGLRTRGVQLNFLVHDLLPVLHPEFFPEHADEQHARWLDCIAREADRLICISHAVADEVRARLEPSGAAAEGLPQMAVLHHGSDIAASAPTLGMPADADAVLARISSSPAFLMVGTIEPRKGHLQAIDAFELLWREGMQVNLVIVGKEGWQALPEGQRRTIPRIIDRLRNHAEAGNRLLWLDAASDEYLDRIYEASTALLFASEGEGFGLPLIEAGRHGLPIIARDLPVTREVAGDHACYFAGSGAEDLAGAIRQWLEHRATGDIPSSAGIPSRSWAQNVTELIAMLAA
jgi:glycosyltransferase involved in cell wall biosynthesis